MTEEEIESRPKEAGLEESMQDPKVGMRKRTKALAILLVVIIIG